MTAGEPLIRLQGITKEYQMGAEIVRALRGVDLTIRANEMVAIMGSSGSGQVDDAQHPGPVGRADGRPVLAGRPGRGPVCRSRRWPVCAGGASGLCFRRSSCCRGRPRSATWNCR